MEAGLLTNLSICVHRAVFSHYSEPGEFGSYNTCNVLRLVKTKHPGLPIDRVCSVDLLLGVLWFSQTRSFDSELWFHTVS